jgi:hypothetical protein
LLAVAIRPFADPKNWCSKPDSVNAMLSPGEPTARSWIPSSLKSPAASSAELIAPLGLCRNVRRALRPYLGRDRPRGIEAGVVRGTVQHGDRAGSAVTVDIRGRRADSQVPREVVVEAAREEAVSPELKQRRRPRNSGAGFVQMFVVGRGDAVVAAEEDLGLTERSASQNEA